MKHNHKRYNKKCSYCNEVMGYCGYSFKEGFADFDDCYDKKDRLTAKGWERMKKYYEDARDIDQSEEYRENQEREDADRLESQAWSSLTSGCDL